MWLQIMDDCPSEYSVFMSQRDIMQQQRSLWFPFSKEKESVLKNTVSQIPTGTLFYCRGHLITWLIPAERHNSWSIFRFDMNRVLIWLWAHTWLHPAKVVNGKNCQLSLAHRAIINISKTRHYLEFISDFLSSTEHSRSCKIFFSIIRSNQEPPGGGASSLPGALPECAYVGMEGSHAKVTEIDSHFTVDSNPKKWYTAYLPATAEAQLKFHDCTRRPVPSWTMPWLRIKQYPFFSIRKFTTEFFWRFRQNL